MTKFVPAVKKHGMKQKCHATFIRSKCPSQANHMGEKFILL